MIRSKIFVFCLVLFSSACSFWQSKEARPDRSIASTGDLSCNGLLGHFFGRRSVFDEGSFKVNLDEVGFGYLLLGARELEKKQPSSALYTTIVSKLEDHIRKGVDLDDLAEELDLAEKKAIWYELLSPQISQTQELILLDLANRGDSLARFLLDVPRGVQRENAESAAILMKKIDPTLDNDAIVARLNRELGTCLNR